MIKTTERRFITNTELRAESQGDEMALVGYASKFNSQSEDLGGFRETVMPGAFARSIREGADVKFLMNHDPSLVMGRTKNSTLKLEEDGTGLRFRVVLPNTQAARDLHALVQRGDIDQCSFAFTAKDQSWEDLRDGNGDMYASRKLLDVDLMDCSAVTYPAYNSTEVYARNAGVFVEARSLAPAAAEEMLSEIGCPEAILTSIKELRDKKHQAETAKNVTDHTAAAAYHEKEAVKADQSGNSLAAMAHKKAASAHTAAADALSKASKDAFKLSHEAKKASKSAHAGEFNSIRSGNERQPFTLESIDMPNPADPKMKAAWYKAFDDKYMELMKKGGQGVGIEQAMAQAIAYANEQLKVQTEVPPTVKDGSSGGKDQTSLPHKVVDTDGDDDADEWERFLALPAEQRVYKGTGDVPDYVPADKKAQWKEVWNSAYKKAKKDGKSAEDAEASAFAQANGVAGPNANSDPKLDESNGKKGTPAKDQNKSGEQVKGKLDEANRSRADKVSDPDSDEYDPDDPDYDPELDETHGEGRATRYGEDRDGKTKTVSGKVLHSKDFAFVGDATDPSTWKLPIHDEGHARNALARFNQTQGIPADKKDGVWKKIVAAAKKFGIKVSEEDSIRCGYKHEQTVAFIEESMYDPIAEGLRAQARLIEIDLD